MQQLEILCAKGKKPSRYNGQIFFHKNSSWERGGTMYETFP